VAGGAALKLSDLNSEVTRVVNSVLSASRTLSVQNSTVVSGVFGGFTGLTCAYLATVFISGLYLPVIGSLLTGLGITAGILVFRRSGALQAEADAARRQVAMDEKNRIADMILGHIRTLPRSAPPEVREKLWKAYCDTLQNLPASQPLDEAVRLFAPPSQATKAETAAEA
jgi:hypothetical protein